MKPRRQNTAVGVDHRIGGLAGEAADSGDPAVVDADIGEKPRVARTIDDTGAADKKFEVRCGQRAKQEQKRKQDTHGKSPIPDCNHEPVVTR